jgi:hypothetical protein
MIIEHVSKCTSSFLHAFTLPDKLGEYVDGEVWNAIHALNFHISLELNTILELKIQESTEELVHSIGQSVREESTLDLLEETHEG